MDSSRLIFSCAFSFFLLVTISAPRARAQAWNIGLYKHSPVDPRLDTQIKAMAKSQGANVVEFTNVREALRSDAKVVVEIEPHNEALFLRTVDKIFRDNPVPHVPALTREGYVLEALYLGKAAPYDIWITAAGPEGIHNGLLRVPKVLRSWPAALAELEPRPRFTAEAEGNLGHAVFLADYPSFPERGVVEGFYGTPWSHQDRLDILDFEGAHGMNVYYYAPKDDPYHRRLWRQPYPPDRFRQLGALARAARDNFVNFCFAISPGLSMTYSSERDFADLTAKLDSVASEGVSCFALFLDDVPQDLQNPADKAKFKTLGAAHVYLINKLYQNLTTKSPQYRLVVTPTVYTGEWGSRDYAMALGAGVDPHVDLVWTGPQVVSPTITVADAQFWGALLRRKPLLWDNYPVNDGIRWRLLLGPLRGRDAKLSEAVAGLFANPMIQPHASMIPLATVAYYLWNSPTYDPERALKYAVEDQYGDNANFLLGAFLKDYGDYWWQENVFQPLFVEQRRQFDPALCNRRVRGLESSLRVLTGHGEYNNLLPEIAPFPRLTRDRITEVESDPALGRAGAWVAWRDDYDLLAARHLKQPWPLNGDFSKWKSGQVYELKDEKQITAGKKLWQGANQYSARVGLGWDDQWLYIGMEVTDPNLYQPWNGRGIENGDAFRLILETAFRKNFDLDKADGDEYELYFSPGDFAGIPPSVFSDEDYLPPRPGPHNYSAEMRMAWRKTPAGFAGDIAIPASYFDAPLRPGYEIGMVFGAQKVIAPAPGTAAEAADLDRIVFTSKHDTVFPARFGNPRSYQRLVLGE